MAQIILDSNNNLIQGDFDNATINNRTKFKTTTTNATTNVYAVPNGSATSAGFTVTNAADPTNASKLTIATNGSTDTQIISGVNGSGTYLPLSFYTNNALAAQIDTSGNFFGTAKMGGVGSVIQVVSSATTTTTTTTSTSFVDTALSASITPSSSSNKILVIVTGNVIVNDLGNNYGDAFANITRGSTEIATNRVAINFGGTAWTDYISSLSLSYLDSPSTTSSTTYKVRIATSNSQIIYPATSQTGTITLMEIKG